MAFGRGHSSFTIDTLKLSKDSLPAAVTEPPPVFPDLVNCPHVLVENPLNDYDYKLKLKFNFNSSFRTLHDSTKDNSQKNLLLNKWTEEWLLLPRELKVLSRLKTSKVKPNLTKSSKTKKKNINIDFDIYQAKEGDDDNEQEDNEADKDEDNANIDENDDEKDGKSKDIERKVITDNENEVDGEISEAEEDMDEDEAADYIDTYFDPGDGDDDYSDNDGGDGID